MKLTNLSEVVAMTESTKTKITVEIVRFLLASEANTESQKSLQFLKNSI